MPLIKVIDECYEALERMKREMAHQKSLRGDPTKTTFSECICLLLIETGKMKI